MESTTHGDADHGQAFDERTIYRDKQLLLVSPEFACTRKHPKHSRPDEHPSGRSVSGYRMLGLAAAERPRLFGRRRMLVESVGAGAALYTVANSASLPVMQFPSKY